MKNFLPLLLFLINAPALADAPAPVEPAPVQKFGAEHPECAAWTDGCMICTPKTCSTPGIACTPHEPVCTAQGAAPEAPKPDAPKPDAPLVPPVAPPAQKP